MAVGNRSPAFGVDDDWRDVSPVELIADPARVRSVLPRAAAARARQYARSGGSDRYDDIGFRTYAATPVRGQVPLRTIEGLRLEWEAAQRKVRDPVLDQLVEEQRLLQHRPLDLPGEGMGHYRFEVQRNSIDFTFLVDTPSGQAEEDTWTFALTNPPTMLLEQGAEDRDLPQLFTQTASAEIPSAVWVPATALVAAGRFRRMQEWTDVVSSEQAPGLFYCFVSHRWLAPSHPDPDGVQARFIAWQIFGHLCEAVRVAHLRGLRTPRRFNNLFGFAVGVSGSRLAESILVNVLRPTGDPTLVDAAASEIATVEDVLEKYGIQATEDDEGLRKLAAVLRSRPVWSALMDRIRLWYDYSCMPQEPRTADEESRFQEGLRYLNAIQVLGRTVVALDDVEDYLRRAWCTLEALVADTELQSIDLILGSPRATASEGVVEHFFQQAMEDRPHLVWRAVLDTEVFGVQTPDVCMARLDLATTEARDLPYVYERLRGLKAPSKIHVDAGELLTGVFPLPVVERPDITLWVTRSGRTVGRAPSAWAPRTLDWAGALRIPDGWSDSDVAGSTPSLQHFAASRDREMTTSMRCHVAVIASCEGEGVLMTRWVGKHRRSLEACVEASVVSLSWLASDIVPVGHFVDGDLRAAPVDADVWVVVATSPRFAHCDSTGLLLGLIGRSGHTCFRLAVDLTKDNVSMVSGPDDGPASPETSEQFVTVEAGRAGFPVHGGGLFRSALVDHLLPVAPDRRPR